MTFAWYGHLKYRHAPLFKVIVISWLIAFAEYCFQVPANRIGSYEFSVAQLKTIQEVITLTVFSVFSVLYFLFSSTAEMELLCRLRADRMRRRGDLQEVVMADRQRMTMRCRGCFPYHVFGASTKS
jgi:uncharacterized protein (DUF486 family)